MTLGTATTHSSVDGTASSENARWQEVLFEEVAVNCTTSAKDPQASGLARFVGLDHLDPESLLVRRWGDIADGTTFTRSFRAGDVLFGKRRAYQRKAAVPDFDGVCSGDILVFRPASECILPAFLVFVVQSDGFVRHALGTSAGSLSPRTRWKDLARYELALPDLERQHEIVNILFAANEYVRRLEDATAAADLALRVLTDSFFGDGEASSRVALAAVAEVRSGLTVNAARRSQEATVPYLRVANVGNAVIDISEVKTIGATDGDLTHYGLQCGDVLVVEGHAGAGEVGRSAIWAGDIEPCLHQNHLFCVRAGASVRPKFLAYALGSGPSRAYFRTRAKSTSGLHTINSTVVRELRVRVPALREQDSFLAEAQHVAECADAAHAALDASRQLAVSLREHLLNPTA